MVAGESRWVEAASGTESKNHRAHSQVAAGRRVWRILAIPRTDVASAGKSF